MGSIDCDPECLPRCSVLEKETESAPSPVMLPLFSFSFMINTKNDVFLILLMSVINLVIYIQPKKLNVLSSRSF